MKRVIPFTRYRIPMFILSAAIIITGIVVLVVKGLNLGIDFRGGMTQQIQIVPVALTLRAAGQEKVEAASRSGQTELLGGEALVLTVMKGAESQSFSFPYSQYATIRDFAEACRTAPGVEVTIVGDPSLATSRLYPVELPVDIAKTELVLNYALRPADARFATIEKVRSALAALGQFEVQTLGRPEEQQFILKMGVPVGDDAEFRQTIEETVRSRLAGSFRAEEIVIRKTDFVGRSLASELALQTVSLVAVALVLVLVYLTFRFHFEFALAAVLCLVQDSAVMMAFILLSGIEFSTITIAAILTIIGYSVNDTVVIFDRVRENTGLMRDSDERVVFDTSISQTLSRTIITSLVTLLAVVAMFVFTSGSLKDFSLILIVGMIEGTWSTIFIASPIVLAWHAAAKRIRRGREERKYGQQTASKGETAAPRAADTEEPLPTAAAGQPGGARSSAEGDSGAVAQSAPASETDRGGAVVRQQPSRKKKRRR